jgi:putative ABC transport system permease protein
LLFFNLTSGPNFREYYTASAARQLGFSTLEDAIGQTLDVPDFNFRPVIVGVVNDYHQVSLKKAIDPTVFYCSPYYGEFYSLRVQTNNLSHTIDHIKKCWAQAFPGNPFEYFFLDDYFNKQYENERKFGRLFSTFAVLAVVIGCLGLFGLSAYTGNQRTKEIGVRKVLGASEQKIFLLLTQEYVKLIAVALLLATPVMWWLMLNWIRGFPYQTTISVTVFLVAGGALLLVSLVTISYQTIRAAKTNPVHALRQE